MQPSSSRLIGIDFAYALAVIGCVVFTFTFTIGDMVSIRNTVTVRETISLSHLRFFPFLDIFPALFFFLNGMTVMLTMRDRRVSSRKLLSYMSKRGSVLFLIGLACCLEWPMNIFIASGLFYIAAPFIAQWNNTLLRVITLLVIALGVTLIYLDVPTTTIYDIPKVYRGEVLGIFHFFLFNGYFSILPWFAFFCAGLVQGRSDVRPKGWLPPSSVVGLVLIVLSFVLQYSAKKIEIDVDANRRSDFFLLNFRLLYPAFIVYALGVSIIVTNAFIYFFRKASNKRVLKFVQTISSMKYSVIFFNMLIGVLTGVISDPANFQERMNLVIFVIVASSATIYCAVLWRKRINEKGPIEWLIKRISGSSKS